MTSSGTAATSAAIGPFWAPATASRAAVHNSAMSTWTPTRSERSRVPASGPRLPVNQRRRPSSTAKNPSPATVTCSRTATSPCMSSDLTTGATAACRPMAAPAAAATQTVRSRAAPGPSRQTQTRPATSTPSPMATADRSVPSRAG